MYTSLRLLFVSGLTSVGRPYPLFLALLIGGLFVLILQYFYCITGTPRTSQLDSGFLQNLEPSPRPFRFQAISSSSNTFRLRGVAPNVKCSDGPANELTSMFSGHIETSILFRFSPLVNNHVQAMFPYYVQHEDWFAVLPFQVSCLPKEKRLVCVLRVWHKLDRYGVFINRFQDSYFYVLELDEQLNYVENSGRILGIPSAVQDIHYTGPEDPRLLMIDDNIVINFVYANRKLMSPTLRHEYLWSLDQNRLYEAKIHHFRQNTVEKNWTPWIVNNSLLFFYELLPYPRIMSCPFDQINAVTLLANCSFVFGHAYNQDNTVSQGTILLRGGSPFVHYADGYYIAVTHSVQPAYSKDNRFYAAQICLLNGPDHRIVFLSSPILLDPYIMASIPSTSPGYVMKPFLYARSVFVEDRDNIVIAAGINDFESVLLRVKGIASILNDAIAKDKSVPVACNVSQANLFNAYKSMENWIKLINRDVLSAYFPSKN